jgi:hemoglobin/transferrin/lactoferrin receptor protein
VLTLQTPTAALAIEASGKRVGDMRAGGGRDSRAAVTRFLGIPSDVVSTRLEGTGFEQQGAQVTARVRTGRTGLLSGFYRRDTQSGVNRYDRVGGGEGLFRSEIVPQRFDFGVLRFERGSMRVVDGFRASMSINRQQDGTLEQARPTARIDSDRTAATALGYQGEATKRFRGTDAVFGGEIYDETIDAERSQTTAGVAAAIRPLIPDGTRYRSTGLFGQAASRELAGRVSLRGGVRYNTYRYQTLENAPFAVHAERVTSDAVTFNSAATVVVTPSLRATVSASRGFRAANASDLGAVGVSGGGGFEISPAVAADLHAMVGSTDGADATTTGKRAGGLGPESEYAYEAGLRFRKGAVSMSATAFDLELFDAIQRRALIFDQPVVGLVVSGREIVRQDSEGRAYIAIDPRPVGTRVNSSRARVRGLDAEGSIRAGLHWNARAYFSMANGRDLETGASMRRMAPPMGGAVIGWQRAQESLRLEGTIAFARPQNRLSSGDLSDARIGGRRTTATIASYFTGTAVDTGLVKSGILRVTGETLAQVQARLLNGASASMLYTREPGWVAVGARALLPLAHAFDLIVIGENLTDRNYRIIGSGVDAPGANAQVRLRVRF